MDDDRVLTIMRDMKETDLHKKVVLPLLKRIAMHVSYVHGSFERGKDFLYIANDVYGKSRLTVAQVKNEPFSGNATSRNSVIGTLNQLLQCRDVKVLNPLTSMKEIPQEVVFFTLFDLPDAPLADADLLLQKVRKHCTIVGPHDIVGLVKSSLPELYADLATPGEGLMKVIRRFVVVHHEASAFDISKRFQAIVGHRFKDLLNSCDAKQERTVPSWSSRVGLQLH